MKFWTITSKDLRLLVRDRRALMTLLLFPLIFITIIGLTTGQLMGFKSANQVIRVAAVDALDYESIIGQEGRTNDEERRRARNLVVTMMNGIQSRSGLEVREVTTDDAATLEGRREFARGLYRNDKVNVAMIFGPELYERVGELDFVNLQSRLEQGLGSLDVAVDSGSPQSSTHDIVEQLLLGSMISTIYPYVGCSTRAEGPQGLATNVEIRRRCDTFQQELNGPKLQLVPPEPAEPVRDDTVYRELIPGFTVMFVFFLVNIMARSFIAEREIGTMRRLRMAPVRPWTLLLGKTVPFFMISVVQTVLLFVCGRLLFKMSWGEQPAMLFPVMVCTSLAATALGLLVATLVRTDSQVSAYANLIVISLAGISGCFMPRDWLPEAMQTISLATPHAWALKAYDQLLGNTAAGSPDMALVLAGSGMLVLFAAAFFVLGALRFRTVD